MEKILFDIVAVLKSGKDPDGRLLAKIIRAHNRDVLENKHHHAKKKLLPYYLKVKENDPERWLSWEIDADLEKRLLKLLQVKPRRTASGVATITVITKPWKCSGSCLFCPNDLRMPKSYLCDEPACQRAERNYFDPYLQVVSRLRALRHMGHTTDKVELIVLGGTWNDYPETYRIWFVKELFRALNESSGEDDFSTTSFADRVESEAKARRRFYREAGLLNSEESLGAALADAQRGVNDGSVNYTVTMKRLYEEGAGWKNVSQTQMATYDELYLQHTINESAEHRVVGLVVETRPDAVDTKNLTLLRQLGCTKVQIGIQSLNDEVLRKNRRGIDSDCIKQAFSLLRLFGFKIHAHFMVNLFGSSVDADKKDYLRFVSEASYQPDEVKLYPCSLVEGTGLCISYANGSWRPYSEEELMEVLVADVLATPPFVRISRMIRDISAKDIVAGNKKTNLRQMVERKVAESGEPVREIRYREIAGDDTDVDELSLEVVEYKTDVTDECFLQSVTPNGKIAGYLRLSLPDRGVFIDNKKTLPVSIDEAMIREVHVYGKVAKLKTAGENAQHLGLGKRLVEKACEIAMSRGYTKINVISSVGTREYYRNLGFTDNGLYQRKSSEKPYPQFDI